MNKALFLTPLLLDKERKMRSRGREKKKWRRTVWLLLTWWGDPYISHMAGGLLGAPSLGG